MKGISIIVCCYNSSKRLPETIKHLGEQKISESLSWEVIIVNNNSKDNTVEIAKQELQKYSIFENRYNIVEELKPGLSFAREKGIQVAQHDYLLFCDDDNWLNPSYLTNAFAIMDANKQIGALGGLGYPKFEIEPDKWIKKYEGIYATGSQAEKSGEVSSQHVYGAACCYRKSAIEKLFHNEFSYYLTGRQGEKLTSGEDHELCYALVLIGYKVWYDEMLEFHHFIPKERVNYNYIERNMDNFFNSDFYLNIYKALIKHGKQNNIKKSWIWIVLNRLRFSFTDLIEYLKNINDPFASFILTKKLKSLLFLILHRERYNRIKIDLETSEWIRIEKKENTINSEY